MPTHTQTTSITQLNMIISIAIQNIEICFKIMLDQLNILFLMLALAGFYMPSRELRKRKKVGNGKEILLCFDGFSKHYC